MSRIERKIAKSSFGTRSVTAARATVSKSKASRVVHRAAQIRSEKSSGSSAPKPKRDDI